MCSVIETEYGAVIQTDARPCRTPEDRDQFVELLVVTGRKHTRVVIDCSKLEWVTGLFLSALVAGFRRTASRRGDIVLCGLGQVLREAFTLTKLDVLFPIHETREAALRSAGPDPVPFIVEAPAKSP